MNMPPGALRSAESRQQLLVDILALLQQEGTERELLRSLLSKIRTFAGTEATGIRLNDGEDYPYYETLGFPEIFVEKERYLCGAERDSQGRPVLACMCGAVIQGRTDPTLPYFTPRGSFWINSATELLASAQEEDRAATASTRNRCHAEGYESVALIPLRSRGEVIGLLQLNDRRRDRFTPDLIAFYENLGLSVGVLLERKRHQLDLQESEAKHRTLF